MRRRFVTTKRKNQNILESKLHGLKIGWALASLRKNPNNDRTCICCGKHFHRTGNRKYRCGFVTCSKECKNKYQGRVKYRTKPRRGAIVACVACGKERYFPPSAIQKYCSMNCRNDDGRFFKRGENHYRWKGGVKRNRKSDFKSRKWRRILIKTFGRFCRKCGIEEKVMYADHILPWADFPENRYEVSNGQILCKIHHIEKTKEENKNRDIKGNLNASYKSTLISSIRS